MMDAIDCFECSSLGLQAQKRSLPYVRIVCGLVAAHWPACHHDEAEPDLPRFRHAREELNGRSHSLHSFT